MKYFSNKQYYKDEAGRLSSQYQFDYIEATISHLFRIPHPALDGLSYGAAFCKKLLENGFIGANNPAVLEVGGGLGFFARDFLTAYNQVTESRLSYYILDLSSNLQNSQKATIQELPVEFILADGQKLPFQDDQFNGLIISNEVIADFDAVEVSYAEWQTSDDEWITILRDADNDTATFETRLINTGALAFIKEIARVLTPGNIALLSEHGLDNEARIARTGSIDQDLHLEYSINFADLKIVAEKLGLNVEVVQLIDFLNFDREIEVANLNDAQALNSIDANWPLAAIPAAIIAEQYGCTIDELRASAGLKLPKIGGTGFPDDHTLPFAESFKIIILQKV